MFFKTEKQAKVQVGVTEAPTAADIHAEFYSTANKAVEEAKNILAQSTPLISKAERLRKLGFNSTRPVVETYQIEVDKNNAKLILDYSVRYPLQKFINESQVQQICKKYNLLLGDGYLYKGDIPEKNLKEIEAFKLKEEDWFNTEYWGLSGLSSFLRPSSSGYNGNPRSEKYTPALKICAPQKDFAMDQSKIVEHTIVPKDPVVLQPIKGGYLIITAWGDEASDELVVNEIKN